MRCEQYKSTGNKCPYIANKNCHTVSGEEIDPDRNPTYVHYPRNNVIIVSLLCRQYNFRHIDGHHKLIRWLSMEVCNDYHRVI